MPMHAGGGGRIQGAGQIRRAGKQGGRVSIIAHAQYHGIERARHSRECLPGRYGAQIRRGRAVLQAVEARGSGSILQQHLAHQAFVARRVLRAHPAFVGQGDADAAPIEGLRAQDFEHSHRRAAARNDQAGESARADGRGESPRRFGSPARATRFRHPRSLHGRSEVLHGRRNSCGGSPFIGVLRVHHATQIHRARSSHSRQQVPSCRRCRSSAVRRIVPSRPESDLSTPRPRRVHPCA